MDRYIAKGVGALHAWAEKHNVPFDMPIYLGVSGGTDSLALMIAASKSRFTNVTVLTVDHGIQQGSYKQALRVSQQASELGLPCVIEKVSEPCSEGSGNMEALAREGRYDIFYKYPMVLIAHTMNDQMETMLLGYGRGSGTRSIQGMKSLRDNIGRPFLDLTREDMEAMCTSADMTPWHDPHNQHHEFRRVSVRHTLVPVFEKVFGKGVMKNFARTAEQLQEDGDALDQWAASITPSSMTEDHLPLLPDVPVAVQKRVLRSWLQGRDTELNAYKINTILSLQNGKKLSVGDYFVTKTRDGWHIATK